jgi:ribA/ribD-fused uncharacterized protein
MSDQKGNNIKTNMNMNTPKQSEKRKQEDNTPPSLQKERKKCKPEDNENDGSDSDSDLDVQVVQDSDGIGQAREDREEQREDLLNRKLDSLVQSVEFLTTSVQEMKDALADTKKDMKSMSIMKEEMNCLKEQNSILLDKIRKQEDYSRRDNLIITGISETGEEDCRKIAAKFLRDIFEMDNVDIVRAHRLGAGQSEGEDSKKKDRRMIIRFKHHEDKENIMKNKWKLKDKLSGVYLDDDFCEETARRRASLRPILKEMKKHDDRAHLRGDQIFSKGRLYTQRNLTDLPIDTHLTSTKSEGDATLFSGTFSKLSNLHLRPIELDGVQWHSVEHYVQYNKAEGAGDTRRAREIRMTSDPLDAMAVGRRVKPGDSWKKKGPEVMRKAQIAKFSQPAMKVVLQNTRRVIMEATKDKHWGIGVSLNDKDVMNSRKWVGENLVGKMLMEVRELLAKE